VSEDIKTRYDPNFIDRMIGFVSPMAAYNRMCWRSALRSAYDAGGFARTNNNWVPMNGTAEQTDRGRRDIIRNRARDLERNNDMFEALVSPFTRNVVGTGIRVQAKVKNKSGEEDEELNRKIETLFSIWSRPENCDLTGTQTFAELQKMTMRRIRVDGGILFIKASTKDGVLPFKLQAREVDDLDTFTSMSLTSGGNRIVAGIEVDKYNKPIAYYFRDVDPEGFFTGNSTRVEASRVIALWEKRRPSQIREISPMANTMVRIKDTDEYVEALTVKERILACFGIAIKKQAPALGGSVGRGLPAAGSKVDPKTGYNGRAITPGMMLELLPGDEAQSIAPNGTGTAPKEFISTQQRLAGGGQGLSYEAVSRDMSQVNYSSARQGMLEDRGTYREWQQFLIDHFCRVVYEEFLTAAIIAGKLPITMEEFNAEKERYLEHRWIAPGWAWIDPLKEAKADQSALENNLDTLENLLESKGMDWKETMEQRAKEKKFIEQLGIGGVEKNAGKTEVPNQE